MAPSWRISLLFLILAFELRYGRTVYYESQVFTKEWKHPQNRDTLTVRIADAGKTAARGAAVKVAEEGRQATKIEVRTSDKQIEEE